MLAAFCINNVFSKMCVFEKGRGKLSGKLCLWVAINWQNPRNRKQRLTVHSFFEQISELYINLLILLMCGRLPWRAKCLPSLLSFSFLFLVGVVKVYLSRHFFGVSHKICMRFTAAFGRKKWKDSHILYKLNLHSQMVLFRCYFNYEVKSSPTQ